MSPLSNVTDTGPILLASASQPIPGSLSAPPASIITKPRPLAKSIASLVKRGFDEERETDDTVCIARCGGNLR